VVRVRTVSRRDFHFDVEVVDNRPGAGSLNGTDTVAKATPDGYTLLVVAASFTITPAMQKNMPFDPVRDFIPITQFADLPHIVVVHPSVPAKSLSELIALLKSRPGEITCGFSGIGTSTHLAIELFQHMAGLSGWGIAEHCGQYFGQGYNGLARVAAGIGPLDAFPHF